MELTVILQIVGLYNFFTTYVFITMTDEKKKNRFSNKISLLFSDLRVQNTLNTL